MADKPISFEDFVAARRPDYVPQNQILNALEELEHAANDITAGSVAAFGAVDILAYEISVHVTAIRRALESESREG